MIEYLVFLSGVFVSFGIFLDKTAREDLKVRVSSWLASGYLPGDVNNWGRSVTAVFDVLFGDRIFAWRFLFRSLAWTLVGSFFSVLIWVAAVNFWIGISAGISKTAFLLFWCFAFLASIIPDYFALIKTRAFLMVLDAQNVRLTKLHGILFCCFDGLFTVGITIVIAFMVSWGGESCGHKG